MSTLIVPGIFAGDHNSSTPKSPWHVQTEDGTSQPANKKRILVVDDETLIADTLTQILNESGFEAITAYTAESALQLAGAFQPDILMSDVLMPNTNGVELAISIRNRIPTAKILLFSGQPATGGIIQNARERGHFFEVLAKPVLPELLIAKLKAM